MGKLDELINQARDNVYDYTENSGAPRPGPARSGYEGLTLDQMLSNANLSDDDVKEIKDSYQKQFGGNGQAPISAPVQQSSPPTPQRKLASSPMGPPAPTAAPPTAPALTSTSSLTKVPVDMGKFNPLGKITPGESAPNVQDLIAKLSGQVSPELQAAQQSRNNMQLISLLGKASNQILGGQTHTQPSNDVFNTIEKNAGQGIADIENRDKLVSDKMKQQEMASKLVTELNSTNPNSSQAAVYRALLNKLTHGIMPTNIGAAELEKLVGPATKVYDAEQASMQKGTDKKAADILKYSKAMGEDLDESRGRNGNLGKLAQVISDSKAIDALSANYSNLNAVPPAQYAEMASSLDRLVSRGNPAIERFKHLMPNNKALTGANILQWVSSQPKGGNQGAFIQNILNTSKAERDVAQKQLIDAKFKKANSTHHKFKELSPEDWYQNLASSTGLSVDEVKAIEGQSGYKGTPVDHPKDSEALDWAKKNPNDPDAQTILKLNGKNQ